MAICIINHYTLSKRSADRPQASFCGTLKDAPGLEFKRNGIQCWEVLFTRTSIGRLGTLISTRLSITKLNGYVSIPCLKRGGEVCIGRSCKKIWQSYQHFGAEITANTMASDVVAPRTLVSLRPCHSVLFWLIANYKLTSTGFVSSSIVPDPLSWSVSRNHLKELCQSGSMVLPIKHAIKDSKRIE